MSRTVLTTTQQHSQTEQQLVQQQQQKQKEEAAHAHSIIFGDEGISNNDNALISSSSFDEQQQQQQQQQHNTNEENESKITMTAKDTNGVVSGSLTSQNSSNNSSTNKDDVVAVEKAATEDVTTKSVEEEDTSSERNINKRLAAGTTAVMANESVLTASVGDIEKDQPDDNSVGQEEDEDGEDGRKKKKKKSIVTKTKKCVKKAPKATRKTVSMALKHGWWAWNCFWARNPRISAVIFRIVIPMSILLGSSMLGGWKLAQYETGPEFDSNDEIMVARRLFERIDLNGAVNAIVDSPISCIDQYYYQTLEGVVPGSLFDDSNATDVVALNFSIDAGLEVGPQYLLDLRAHMINCSTQSRVLLDNTRQLSDAENAALAAQDLTFNWGRCWNTSEYGPYITWQPTPGQLEGAKTQGLFYAKTWRQNQEELYQLYIEQLGGANATVEQQEMAFNQSLADATGRGPCEANRPGTGWFFFTVMTTIGYGNQAPTTYEGRVLTAGWGFVCIILFAAILGTTGNVIAAIYSDTVRRFNLSCLSYPIMTTAFWCVVAFAWTIGTAEFTYRWWGNRLDPDDVPTRYDAQWFAYISTTTVGLGDFFINPEVMFVHDAFAFAFLFLTAFSLFAAFLTSLIDLISSFIPEHQDVLEVQLEETNLIFGERTLKLWLVRGLNLIPCFNLKEPSLHPQAGIKMKDEHGQEEIVDERTYIDKLTELSYTSNKTVEQLIREEELLQGLLAFKKKERLCQQFGLRKSLQKQAAARHLDVDLGAESFDEENDS